MKPYALVLAISVTIIFILRIFYPASTINISHNLNLFSASKISTQETKNFVFIYLIGVMLLHYIIFHKHILFKLIYCLLITINILLLIFSLKQF